MIGASLASASYQAAARAINWQHENVFVIRSAGIEFYLGICFFGVWIRRTVRTGWKQGQQQHRSVLTSPFLYTSPAKKRRVLFATAKTKTPRIDRWRQAINSRYRQRWVGAPSVQRTVCMYVSADVRWTVCLCGAAYDGVVYATMLCRACRSGIGQSRSVSQSTGSLSPFPSLSLSLNRRICLHFIDCRALV